MSGRWDNLQIHSDIRFLFYFLYFLLPFLFYSYIVVYDIVILLLPQHRPRLTLRKSMNAYECICSTCNNVVARQQYITLVGNLRRFPFHWYVRIWAANHFVLVQETRYTLAEPHDSTKYHSPFIISRFSYSIFFFFFPSFASNFILFFAPPVLLLLLFCHLCVICFFAFNKQKAYFSLFSFYFCFLMRVLTPQRNI